MEFILTNITDVSVVLPSLSSQFYDSTGSLWNVDAEFSCLDIIILSSIIDLISTDKNQFN
jgi:hypothetical protein